MTASGVFGRRRPTPQEERAALKALARAPRVDVRLPVADLADDPRGSRIPWVALGMIALFTVIYLAERAFSFGHGAADMSWRSTVAVGGADRDLVLGQGQVWRLFTAPLLHGSVEHLAGNAAVLAFAGFGLERLIGRAWFAAIFAFGAIAGAVASIAANSPWAVSVGASGGIMALLTAAYVCSFHPEAHEYGARMRWWVYRLAIPSLIPFGAAGGAAVDYRAHLGGAVAGFLFGYALQFLWSEERALPPLRREAALAAGGAGLAAIVAFALIALSYPAYAARQAPLIPDARIPKTTADSLEDSATLVALWPHDPRGHLLRALAAARQDDAATADAEARAGLAERDILAHDFPPQLELQLRAIDALALAGEGRTDEARAQAQWVCGHIDMIPRGRELRAQMAAEHLCG